MKKDRADNGTETEREGGNGDLTSRTVARKRHVRRTVGNFFASSSQLHFVKKHVSETTPIPSISH